LNGNRLASLSSPEKAAQAVNILRLPWAARLLAV
jgi:hypothetical protein